MRLYGSDKPDLRIDLKLVDIDELMRGVEFKVFSGPASDAASRVVALRFFKVSYLLRLRAAVRTRRRDDGMFKTQSRSQAQVIARLRLRR